MLIKTDLTKNDKGEVVHNTHTIDIWSVGDGDFKGSETKHTVYNITIPGHNIPVIFLRYLFVLLLE